MIFTIITLYKLFYHTDTSSGSLMSSAIFFFKSHMLLNCSFFCNSIIISIFKKINVIRFKSSFFVPTVFSRWVLVRRDKKQTRSYWWSDIGHRRLVTEQGQIPNPLPTLADGFVTSPSGQFLGSWIIVTFIIAAVLSCTIRLYFVNTLGLAAAADFCKDDELHTKSVELSRNGRFWAWRWSWFYVTKVFITESIIFAAFVVVPLADFFIWDHYHVIRRWIIPEEFSKVVPAELTWKLAYYLSEFFQAYNRFKFIVFYLSIERYRIYDQSNDEVNWQKLEYKLWDGISSISTCHWNYYFYMLPISYGALTLFIIVITNRPRIKVEDTKSPNHLLMVPIFKITGLPKDFKGYMEYKVLQWVKYRESLRFRRIRRYQRMEWWLGEPIVNTERLRDLTVKMNRTEEEDYLLDEEWYRYYQQLDANDRINGRFRIKKKKFEELSRQRWWKRRAVQKASYEKLINSKKLTYKQYLHKIKLDIENDWELEKDSVGLFNLLPTNEEKILFRKYLNSLKSSRNLWIYRQSRWIWSWFERRVEDYEDYYYIYWEYASDVGNKLFPNLRRNVRLYIQKLKFNISQKARLKLKRFYLLYLKPSVYFVWYRFIKRPFKKLKIFYFTNIKYPIEKRLISIKVLAAADYKKFERHVIKNPDKLHVKAIIMTIKVTYNFVFAVIALLDFFINEPFRFSYKYIKPVYDFVAWYLSKRKRKLTETNWRKHKLALVKRDERESAREYQHHLSFDRFIRKLGWFKKLLPVNLLRRLYVNFYTEPDIYPEDLFMQKVKLYIDARARRRQRRLDHKVKGPKFRKRLKLLNHYMKRRIQIDIERRKKRMMRAVGTTPEEAEKLRIKRKKKAGLLHGLAMQNKQPEKKDREKNNWWF